MIRRATFTDIPELEAMLREMHAASKYFGRVLIADKAMREMLMGMVAAQGQNGPQASFVRIAEQRGRPVGFMAGVLDRVYHIGQRLTANDVFLHVRRGGEAAHTLRLIDAYVEWASSNPKVIEVMLSWADTLPGAERVAQLYQRKGFRKIGEMFEMQLDLPAREMAA